MVNRLRRPTKLRAHPEIVSCTSNGINSHRRNSAHPRVMRNTSAVPLTLSLIAIPREIY